MTEGTQLEGLTVAAWQNQSVDLDGALHSLQQRVDLQEPRIHALVAEDARFERLRSEMEDSTGGPLARVPVGIKDIFHVDGLPTQAGAQIPATELAGTQASAVSALKQAGAAILGKTVTTEFAYFAPGPTRNPHDIDHTPGGSSSGSAAAVAAGYCPLALGTQTIGSISRPASFCGIAGYKPSYGRIPTDGVLPLSPSLDHVGVFGSLVEDLALAASILCTAWSPVPVHRRPVLGIPRGPYLEKASKTGLESFKSCCAALEARGWEIRSHDLLADIDEIEVRNQQILAAEVARVHQEWFGRFGDLYHEKTRYLIELGQRISDAELNAALAERQRFRERLERETVEAGVDLWISPAAPGPAPRGLASTGDPVMNLPWSQAGVPTLALPTGAVGQGLPIGLQLVGKQGADEALLSWAPELATGLRRVP